MYTLGIETSCDETSCSVLKDGDKLLSNVISSSLFKHKPFGGIVPEIASRHSLEQMDVVFQESLSEAGVKITDLDLIAVTEGPGLIGSLLVGISFAKALALRLGIPLVGVNHLEAHLVANFIGAKTPGAYVGLLVSGGHSMISYHKAEKITVLGSTVDDAAGEAYDKVAKILGLGYPGGPVMDKLAGKGNPDAFRFTKPRQDNPFDFSFSGIKTAVLYASQKNEMTDTFKADIAASFQKSVVGWMVDKTLDAAEYKKVKDVVVGGGVSANSALRSRLPEEGAKRGIKVWFPERILSLDNAGMIARRGYELYKKGKKSKWTLTGVPNLKMGRKK